MLWFLVGAAILAVMLYALRAFERASVTSIHSLLKWIAILGGALMTLLLFISGRGVSALAGLVLVGPALWRHWQNSGSAPFGSWTPPHQQPPHQQPPHQQPPPPPPPRGGNITPDEAYEILGLRPGASSADIVAAHRRLMRTAHPDAGGSDWLAARINRARDVLLG